MKERPICFHKNTKEITVGYAGDIPFEECLDCGSALYADGWKKPPPPAWFGRLLRELKAESKKDLSRRLRDESKKDS